MLGRRPAIVAVVGATLFLGAFLATERIDFAPSVAKAMDYAFGNTIVCADAKAAKKVRARG